MGRAREGHLLTPVGADEEVARRPHRPDQQHRLPRGLVIRREVRPPRPEGPGGPLPVDHGLQALPVHVVLLPLGRVMGHPVDQVHLHIVSRSPEGLLEGRPHVVHDDVPVDERPVDGARHRLVVVLCLPALQGRTSQLPSRDPDVILPDGPVHHPDVVRGDLVAVPPGPRVDPGHDLIGPRDPEGPRRLSVEHLLHPPNLEEMVPRPEGAQLA